MALLKNFRDFGTDKLLLPGLPGRKQGESLHRRCTDMAFAGRNSRLRHGSMLEGIATYDAIGIVGSLFIAGPYLAVTRKRLAADQPSFQALNLVGAGLILISPQHRPNAGAVLIEVLWIGIAIMSLFGDWRKRSRVSASPRRPREKPLTRQPFHADQTAPFRRHSTIFAPRARVTFPAYTLPWFPRQGRTKTKRAPITPREHKMKKHLHARLLPPSQPARWHSQPHKIGRLRPTPSILIFTQKWVTVMAQMPIRTGRTKTGAISTASPMSRAKGETIRTQTALAGRPTSLRHCMAELAQRTATRTSLNRTGARPPAPVHRASHCDVRPCPGTRSRSTSPVRKGALQCQTKHQPQNRPRKRKRPARMSHITIGR